MDLEREGKRQRESEGGERKLTSRSYQVNLREFEGDWRPANCSEPERGCPIFTSLSKSNLSARSCIGTVAQLSRFPVELRRNSEVQVIAILMLLLIYLYFAE